MARSVAQALGPELDLHVRVPNPEPVATPQPRSWFQEAEPGRLVELSGRGCSAQTTLALEAIRRAQDEGETTVWIQPAKGPLFPPDARDRGIDLQALTVVQIPLGELPYGPCHAAETLLRSGGFGLVVLDLRAHAPPLHDLAWQSRLCGFARKHHARLLVLTTRAHHEPSLGPLVSLRFHLRRRRRPLEPSTKAGMGPVRVGPGRFEVTLDVLKNKSGSTVAPTPELFRGPWGVG